MRHGKGFRKLNRTAAHRRALLRNMVTSLIEHEQITTTDAKAKELRKVFEKMVTLAKDGSLHSRRQALSYVRTKDMVNKLFTDIATRFADRNGGYVQIVKLGLRRGDAAPMSMVSLTEGEIKKASRRQRRKKKAGAEATKTQQAEAPKAETAKDEAPKAETAKKKAPAKKAAPAKEKVEAAPEEAPVEEAAPAEDKAEEAAPVEEKAEAATEEAPAEPEAEETAAEETKEEKAKE